MPLENLKLSQRQNEIVSYLKNLREDIIKTFSNLDHQTPFARESWPYKNGKGGGEMAVLRAKVFEKAAVNISIISGEKFPMDDGVGPFFATGISLITHMQNPHAPTVHFNIRYIETKKNHWFGGGYDLTPMGFYYEDDKTHFHKIAKESLDCLDRNLYPRFSQNAKEYFYIPHYQKERGVGGIFFDHINSGDFKKDYQMWQKVGDSFLQSVMPIYEKRIHSDYHQEDKNLQLKMRAHYVEFNLLYDRGTKFGFQSGGNPKAILCSMPPLAAW